MAAANHAGESILAAIYPPFSSPYDVCPSGHLCLYPEECVFVDDRRVRPFHIVLRKLPVIFASLLVQDALSLCFLQERIADILLIGQDLFDVALVPFRVVGTVQDTISFKAPLDLQETGAIQVF